MEKVRVIRPCIAQIAMVVPPERIETISQGEVVYESVIKAYLECACGAEIARGEREIF